MINLDLMKMQNDGKPVTNLRKIPKHFFAYINAYHELPYEFSNIFGLFSWYVTGMFHKEQETINQIDLHLSPFTKNIKINDDNIKINWVKELIVPLKKQMDKDKMPFS